MRGADLGGPQERSARTVGPDGPQARPERARRPAKNGRGGRPARRPARTVGPDGPPDVSDLEQSAPRWRLVSPSRVPGRQRDVYWRL